MFMSFTKGLQMRPERQSQVRLSVTRSKAKMFEYGIPEEHHINITQDPSRLFTISIGMLGDLAAGINHDELAPDLLAELQSSLVFSARFFDSYLQSRLNENLDPYLVLLGSASYYLSDLPGSSSVLARQIEDDFPDLNGSGLEDLLHWLLQADLQTYFDGMEGAFGKYIDEISQLIREFFDKGINKERLIDLAMELRGKVYEVGTPRLM